MSTKEKIRKYLDEYQREKIAEFQKKCDELNKSKATADTLINEKIKLGEPIPKEWDKRYTEIKKNLAMYRRRLDELKGLKKQN